MLFHIKCCFSLATDQHCSQRDRLQAIENYCRTHPHLATLSFDQRSPEEKFYVFLVDETHQLVYCGIPKTGMTLWRTMIARATGKLNTTGSINISDREFLANLGLKFLYHYPSQEQERILKEYFKVMSVRHPLDRLVSAYVDKFTNSYMDTSIVRAVSYVNYTYRSQENKIFLPRGKMSQPTGVEFGEFIKVVIDEEAPRDIHWDNMHSICHPCDIKYDYVIRQETMAEDAVQILAKLSQGRPENLTLSAIHSHRGITKSDSDFFQRYIQEFQTIDLRDLQQVKAKYTEDMEMFGYSFHMQNKSLMCNLNTGSLICC